MNTILDSYDLSINELPEFYRKMNEPIRYPDGMVTSLGIVYWGREEHAAELESAIPALKAADFHHIRELLETVRLIPWPKEVRNGIEWAKLHLSIFAVAW